MHFVWYFIKHIMVSRFLPVGLHFSAGGAGGAVWFESGCCLFLHTSCIATVAPATQP